MTRSVVACRIQRPLSTEWSFFINRNMQTAFKQEVDHFTLFLENHDGISHNALLKSLSWIYQNVEESDYYDSALFEASQFVSKFFAFFWSKYCNQKDLFLTHKNEIISIVAFRFAHSALNEFKLGNLY